MNFSEYEIDISLFLIFQHLIQYRNVTKTAKQLDLSQPAVSRKLAKLRAHFNDPLFVRTGQGLAPTPFAIEIAPSIQQLMLIYQSEIHHHEEFDPSKSERKFSIASTEIGHNLLIPRLLKECSKIAPAIRFDAVRPSTNSMVEKLEIGEIDLALGSYPNLYSGIYEKTLAPESYVCAVRKGHPDIKGTISIEQFEAAEHIIVSTKGVGHIHRQIEKLLFDRCSNDRIRVVSENFITAALLAEETNCIATLPSRLADMFGDRLRLQYIEPPIEVPSFDIKLYWHERFHLAPANQWLREVVTRVIR